SSTDLYLFPLTASLTIPHVTTLHSNFPFDHHGPRGHGGEADRYYMDWASCVPLVAISESARDPEKLPLHFVDVVHNGIEMSQFPLPRKKREDYLVWLGRFVPEKGPHLAIEAAKRAQVPIVLAGTVDQHVQASVDYFEQVIKPCIDQQQVTYIGPVDGEQKMEWLGRARALRNPIQGE